jgi:hypothetical protein
MSSIDETTRSLALSDLQRALLFSNRNLNELFNLDSVLKTEQELLNIANNTEKSIYLYSANTQEYIENILIYILFLTDENLSKDLLLFRFFVNIDMDDLYLEPNSEELLIYEILYSDIKPINKKKILNSIISGIQQIKNDIISDYYRGDNYTPRETLQYDIDKKSVEKIEQYQSENLNLIYKKLYNDDEFDFASEAESDRDYYNDEGTDDNESDLDEKYENYGEDVRNEGTDGDESDREEVDDEGRAYGEARQAYASDEELQDYETDTNETDTDEESEGRVYDEEEEEHLPPSSQSDLIAKIKKIQSSTPSPSPSPAPLLTASSNDCTECKQSTPIDTSYITPTLINGKKDIAKFCDDKCMEKWDIKLK